MTILQRIQILEKKIGIKESQGIFEPDDDIVFLTPKFQWDDEARRAKLYRTEELAEKDRLKYGGDDVQGIDDQFAVIRYPESDEY